MDRPLIELCKEAWNDATAVGVPVAAWDSIDWRFNQKIGHAWGCCTKTLFGYTIRLSHVLCQHTTENSILNTVIHELIHAAGVNGHRRAFKHWAAVINKAYPGKYDVARCTAAKDKMSLEEAKTTYRYVVVCPECNAFWGSKRLSYYVRNPERSSCPFCKKKTGKTIPLARIQ